MVRERLRRPLLFLITVGTGSLIIVLDAAVEVVVAGTVLAGFLALVVTGALDLRELRPSRMRSALRERKKKEQPEAKPPDATVEEESSGNHPSAGPGLSGMLGTLTASIRETIAHARAPEGEKKNRLDTIDAMLDDAVDGAVPDLPATPKAGGGPADPLAALADLDIDSLEDFDLEGDLPDPGTVFGSNQISLLTTEDTDAISEILKAHQSEIDEFSLPPGIGIASSPAATNAPALPGDTGMPDMSALNEELSALDDLEIGEIEIEGEDGEAEADAEGSVPDEEIAEEEEETKEDFDMISFASGGTVDDDLIIALKSESKKKKYVEDISLVRELRGEKYPAKDLAAELEEILAAMKAQR